MPTSIDRYLASWAELQKLVSEQWSESAHLDFKRLGYANPRKPKELQEQDKIELRRDATAFANSEGGVLLLGVEEDAQGRAGAVPGINQARQQEDFVRDVLNRFVEPLFSKTAIRVQTIEDPANPGRGVVVVHVAPCEPGLPHAVLGKGDEPMEFWLRTDKSKRRMSYQQVRASFRAGEEEAEQKRVDSVALNEIWKIRHAIQQERTNFKKMLELLEPLAMYVEGYQFGLRVRAEVIYTAGELLHYPRAGMPVEVARGTVHIIKRALSIYMSWNVRNTPLTKEEQDLFVETSSYGYVLAYDGIKHLEDLGVVGAGALLGHLLEIVHFHGWSEEELKVRDSFQRAMQTAQELRNDDALRVLRFYEESALAGRRSQTSPPPPQGLEWVIFESSRPGKEP